MGLDHAHARYLRLLAFAQPPAGLDGLRELVNRHLCRVPFENVSKLLLYAREGAGRPFAMSEFLDGIEHCDFGGTCYTNNPFLAGLLRHLGYDADLLGVDMQTRNVHTGIRVRLAGSEYHVDVGYAAPFREPVPLAGLPLEIQHGPWRYVFDPDGGHCRLSAYRDGELMHGYVVHGPPRDFAFFRPVILDSYTPGRTFMTCLRITRFFEDGAVELRDRALIRYGGAESSVTELATLAELESAVSDAFLMPRCRIREAVRVLDRLTGTPLF